MPRLIKLKTEDLKSGSAWRLGRVDAVEAEARFNAKVKAPIEIKLREVLMKVKDHSDYKIWSWWASEWLDHGSRSEKTAERALRVATFVKIRARRAADREAEILANEVVAITQLAYEVSGEPETK